MPESLDPDLQRRLPAFHQQGRPVRDCRGAAILPTGVTFRPRTRRMPLWATTHAGNVGKAGRCSDGIAPSTACAYCCGTIRNGGDARWLGQLRPWLKSASAWKSTAICRPNSKPLKHRPVDRGASVPRPGPRTFWHSTWSWPGSSRPPPQPRPSSPAQAGDPESPAVHGSQCFGLLAACFRGHDESEFHTP